MYINENALIKKKLFFVVMVALLLIFSYLDFGP